MATQTPAELADLFASRRGLTDIERVDLAKDFVRNRGETGLLRRCDYFSVPSVAPETPLKA